MWNDIEDQRANLRAEEKPFVIATVVAYKSPQAATLPIIQKTEPAAESLAASGEARDPVCGMVVQTAGARYESTFGDRSFYFCCLRCKETFDRSPQHNPNLKLIQHR